MEKGILFGNPSFRPWGLIFWGGVKINPPLGKTQKNLNLKGKTWPLKKHPFWKGGNKKTLLLKKPGAAKKRGTF